MNAHCEQYSHLIPNYCLGALDETIRAEIEAILPDCPELAELVATYQVVAEPLLYSAPPATAPAHLLDNILHETRKTTASKPHRLNFQSPLWRNIAAGLMLVVVFGASNFYWYQRTDDLQQEVVTLNDALEVNIVAQNQSLANDISQANPYANQQIPIGISMNNSQATNNISQLNN